VTCDRPTLAVGAAPPITITVSADLEGTITNTASVTASENDPDAANNSDSEDTLVVLIVVVCSTLGDDPQGNLDQDVWTFDGVEGENVAITLDAQNNGGRANLILIQDGGGLSITDHTDLPNNITVDLPASGTYIIAVTQQSPDDLLPGNPFTGDYCLTVDAQFGVTLTPDPSVE